MFEMFNPERADPKAVHRVKTLVSEKFVLDAGTILSVVELRCLEADCPPVETVITARKCDGSVRDWRIPKAVNDIERADIEMLSSQL
ncbi:MAG: hypothetical protein OXC63_09170 [Aestuariivita sp.]|nr:hypothetical protein [Aestuariivita sp.]MCY4346690.1 hypothetical protein [Aestuariivita sp.]